VSPLTRVVVADLVVRVEVGSIVERIENLECLLLESFECDFLQYLSVLSLVGEVQEEVAKNRMNCDLVLKV
jgi:hypothetical protein